MYRIVKTFEIAVAHKLNLEYESPCSRIHGHNLKVRVMCSKEELNQDGMVIDFTEIKKRIHDKLDHRCLNDIEKLGFERMEPQVDPSTQFEIDTVELNPTAERLAKWIYDQIPHCTRVDVWETENNVATYWEMK